MEGGKDVCIYVHLHRIVSMKHPNSILLIVIKIKKKRGDWEYI